MHSEKTGIEQHHFLMSERVLVGIRKEEQLTLGSRVPASSSCDLSDVMEGAA